MGETEREFDIDPSFLVRIQTGISAAYWYDPKRRDYSAAKLETMTRANTSQTAWFDELFEGGLMIPKEGSDSPITVLISGAPGTGKSTLASEICYRLAAPSSFANQPPLRSIYVTTEGHAPWTIAHARSFGWDGQRPHIFGEDEGSHVQIRSLKSPMDRALFINELDRIESPHSTQQSGTGPSATASIKESGSKLFDIAQGILDVIQRRTVEPPEAIDQHQIARPMLRQIMVFDNLNSVSPEADAWFPFVNQLTQKGFRLFIIIVDGGAFDITDAALAKSWAYLADVVIQLGHRYPAGYMIHTIEVLKARYQRHVFGRHQMKLVTPNKTNHEAVPRDHPYRREGGIFIFPSMHLALSRRKFERSESSQKRISTPYPDMDELLGGGFFEGRCVALAGGRGTHKSRLAFGQVLTTLTAKPRSRAIIISLREDETTVASGLSECVPFPNRDIGLDVIQKFVSSGRLELCYYPPGFIAPEEFFHRVQLSVARQKQAAKGDPVLLVFNSLDLLHSHYPLCAEHGIFVPALVELLCLEGVTSFFVATSEQNRDPYGLMSMADPVLRFQRVELAPSSPTRVREKAPRTVASRVLEEGSILVEMTVDRFAGGTSAGSSIYLALFQSSVGSGKRLYGFSKSRKKT